MKSEMKCFLNHLISHFCGREEIYHVHYDGETEPKRVTLNPYMNIFEENTSEAVNKWVAEYVSRREDIHYYELYQHFANDHFNLWVNPTLDELSLWNKNMNLFPSSNLRNTSSYRTHWEEKIHQKLVSELEASDYCVVSGRELIDHLVRSYDYNSSKNISIVDWIKPTDISLLKNNHSYIIDNEDLSKPVLLTMQHILERDSQDFPIDPSHLRLYCEHIEVTQRGIDSVERLQDRGVLFYYYTDIEDYLDSLSYEKKESTMRKLVQHQVDPMKPFIETVFNDYSESYINTDDIQTEKDLLDFVNQCFLIEEIDREAKSFNRKKIIESLLCQSMPNQTNITIRRRDSIGK